jgi:hypothetical protein
MYNPLTHSVISLQHRVFYYFYLFVEYKYNGKVHGRWLLLLFQALVLNMVSYAGKADMQVQVAKDIIPDPEFLAKCFEDALLEMKEQVTNKI